MTFTGEKGGIVYEQNFDAWGNYRNITDWSYVKKNHIPQWLNRGYTGHEHLIRFGPHTSNWVANSPDNTLFMPFNIINMNGRIYDPMIGRMMSPDNYTHDDLGTQGYNRYTYAHNNPLKWTDADGETPIHAAAYAGAALAGGIYNVATNWSKIKGWKSGLAYFGVGAVAGAMVISGNVGGAKAVMIGGNAIIHAATGHLPQVDFKNAPGQSLANLGMYSLEATLNASALPGVANLGGTIATRIAKEWALRVTFQGVLRQGAFVTAEDAFISSLPDVVVTATETTGSSMMNASIGSAISSVSKVGANLNSNAAVSEFGIYEIFKNGQLYKYGKADLTRITQSSGLPTRLHQQIRILNKFDPTNTYSVGGIHNLGQMTTGSAKIIENNYIGQFYDKFKYIPNGNLSSFNLMKWLGH